MLELSEISDRAKDEPQMRIQAMNKLNQRHMELESLVEKLKEENKQLTHQIEEANADLLGRSTKERADFINNSSNLSSDLELHSKEEVRME